MTTDIDLRAKWAKLETEFLELNLLADRNLQRQLEPLRVAFDCEMALPDNLQVLERGTKPRHV